MAKWKVTLEAIVEAETRVEAWKISRQIFEQDLDYIAQVMAVSSQPVPKPAEWIAFNEQSPLHRTPQILARLKGKAQLRVHDKVMIYEDPITQTKPEGKALLLHKIENLPDGLERWKVCFEGEDGGVYERTIKGNK